MDVDVVVTLPNGTRVEGEVTLCPADDGRPVYEAWGGPDNWLSGNILAALDALALDREEFREACTIIEDATSAEAGEPNGD